MDIKLAIVKDEFIPTYRVSFFELLSQKSKIKYTVFHGLPPQDRGYQQVDELLNFSNTKVKNYQFSILGYRIVYQPIIAKILFNHYHALVLGHEVKFIAYLLLFFIYKILGKPVILWGHGFDKDQDRKFNIPFFLLFIVKIKAWLASSADMYIAYTIGGAEKLKLLGVPEEKLVVVNNTLDMQEQYLLRKKFDATDTLKIRKAYNLKLDSIVLIYLGRIYPEKRVEQLLALVKQVNQEKFCSKFVEVVIIGNGSELENLKAKSEENQGIHFTGSIYDQETIASYIRVASALVIPGKVGLAVNHAFAHGLPVITRESPLHAPEIDYIESGVNGLIISGDFDNFVRETANYLNSPQLQKNMSEAALKTGEELSLESMVELFDRAVAKAISCKQ